jgi:hypothetical protein
MGVPHYQLEGFGKTLNAHIFYPVNIPLAETLYCYIRIAVFCFSIATTSAAATTIRLY